MQRREISALEKHRWIFSFNSSTGGEKEKNTRLDLRLQELNVEEYILILVHKDLITCVEC